MTWARFEDRFPWHRKVRGLSDAAFRLHVSAVCWSCEHLTNGHLPKDDLHLLSDVRRPGPAAAELVRKGSWRAVEDGWEIHDFLVYNESRETVLARRAADAERKRKGREARWSSRSPAGVRVDAGRTDVGFREESHCPDPARPDPSTTGVTYEENPAVELPAETTSDAPARPHLTAVAARECVHGDPHPALCQRCKAMESRRWSA